MSADTPNAVDGRDGVSALLAKLSPEKRADVALELSAFGNRYRWGIIRALFRCGGKPSLLHRFRMAGG